MSKTRITVPVFVPHAGCGHKCVFCNQWKVSGCDSVYDYNDIAGLVSTYLSAKRKSVKHVEIAFFGGSFTGIEPDRQIRLLSAAESCVKEGIVNAIRLSTRPDYIDRERLSLLKQFSVETVELGVQSFDDEVLVASGRGHTAADVYKAMEMLKEFGFRTGIQLMPGLPGDSFEKSVFSAEQTVKLKPGDARIYPCVVLAGTRLEEMYLNNKFMPLSLEQAVDLSSRIYGRLTENSINVIRIGLHPVELAREVVIAGPYHTALGFLVKSRYRRDMLVNIFEKEKNRIIGSKGKLLLIPSSFAEEYIGMKKSNIVYLEQNYSIGKIDYKISDREYPELVF